MCIRDRDKITSAKPAMISRKLVKTRAEIPCAIRYWPLVPDKPQAIPATTVYRVPFTVFDILLPTPLDESFPSLGFDRLSTGHAHPSHTFYWIKR